MRVHGSRSARLSSALHILSTATIWMCFQYALISLRSLQIPILYNSLSMACITTACWGIFIVFTVRILARRQFISWYSSISDDQQTVTHTAAPELELPFLTDPDLEATRRSDRYSVCSFSYLICLLVTSNILLAVCNNYLNRGSMSTVSKLNLPLILNGVSMICFYIASASRRVLSVAFAVNQFILTLYFTLYPGFPLLAAMVNGLNTVAFLCMHLGWYTPFRANSSYRGFDNASFFSQYTFWWILPALVAAKTKDKLDMSDLPDLPVADSPTVLEERFRVELIKFFDMQDRISKPIRLLIITCYSIQKRVFLSSYFHGIAFLGCMFIDPIIIAVLLSRPSSMFYAWVLMFALSLSMFIRVSCMEYCYFQSTRVANNVRTALGQAIFNRAIYRYLAVDPAKWSNLMITDADRLGGWSWGVLCLAQWTWAVVSLPFVFYFLHKTVGNGAFLGVCCLLSSAFTSRFFGRRLHAIQVHLQKCRDNRTSCLQAFLTSVKVTKLESLQDIWLDRLEQARNMELIELARIQYVSAFSCLCGALLSLAVPVSMFTWRVLIDHRPLDARTAFTALAWIAQMQWSISTLPSIYNAWAGLSPSFGRIADALLEPDQANQSNLHQFQVSKGLLVVVGATGSGKSTLLNNLASCNTGLLCPQRPFLLNSSIEENVLFGMKLDQDRLDDAIKRTGLDCDLASFPAGQLTQVGPNGVQLSGGQRARIGLARAIYSDSNIILLDDVLSAVDRSTGSHLWSNVITYFHRNGKSVVLVTHELRYLASPIIDCVILMDQGQIIVSSPLNSIPSHIREKYRSFLVDSENDDNHVRGRSSDSDIVGPQLMSPRENGVALSEVYNFLSSHLQTLKGKVINADLINNRILSNFIDIPDHNASENKNTGSVTFSDFSVYLDEFGVYIYVLVALAISLSIASVSANIWLALWSQGESSSRWSQHKCLTIYIILGLIECLLMCYQRIILTKYSLVASANIHRKMASKLVEAPLSFFDTHSQGMILNRFLQDMANIDTSVPSSMNDQISKTLTIISQFTLIAFYAPFVCLIIPIMLPLYVYIFRMVRTAARDSRRLESESKSPVYEFFGDVLRGHEIIHCASAQDRFQRRNRKFVQNMSASKVGNEAVMKWAQALTAQASCLLYFVTGFVGIIYIYRGHMELGEFGLILLYAASLQRGLMDYLMGLTNLETNMISVERVAEFLKLPSEHDFYPTDEGIVDPSSWPTAGKIELADIAMRYAINKPEILKGISITIEPLSKVAIIGRTGCGKSSLFSALASLYPIIRGSIIVDGIRLANLPLLSARNAVTVIPQDPVIFAGTVRSNICFGQYFSDERIWDVLEMTKMSECVKDLGGLDSDLQEGGANLSAGERQLFCMARMLARGQLKVLLCDEPTSNVDRLTGSSMVDVFLGLNATVLMIMHRLENLEKFDRIVLMDSGFITECGAPKNLLSDESSLVRQFIDRYTPA